MCDSRMNAAGARADAPPTAATPPVAPRAAPPAVWPPVSEVWTERVTRGFLHQHPALGRGMLGVEVCTPGQCEGDDWQLVLSRSTGRDDVAVSFSFAFGEADPLLALLAAVVAEARREGLIPPAGDSATD